jgi:hypothetical protein
MERNWKRTAIHRNLAAGGGAILAASFLLAMTAMGCGEQKEKATAEPATSAAEQPARIEAPAAVTASATGNAEPGSSSTDSLPPDVVATAPDTLAIPGSVVVITALGSADVTSVTLNDGAGEKTPFTYDSESNLWRVSYRIPVRVTLDRIGLSVTAATDANRWKRVWVFFKIRGADARVEAASDSGL